MNTRLANEAVAEAMTWLGTPHHHQGRVKGVGVDCGNSMIQLIRENTVQPLTAFIKTLKTKINTLLK